MTFRIVRITVNYHALAAVVPPLGGLIWETNKGTPVPCLRNTGSSSIRTVEAGYGSCDVLGALTCLTFHWK